MKYFLFLILLILFVANLIPSFAQFETNVSVNTDKLSYIDGDTVVISGNVKAILNETPILIQIFDPLSNIIEIAQKDVAQDGSFIHTIKATGPLWEKYGEYTVKVSFGPIDTVEAIFSFDQKEVMSETKKIFEVDAGSYGTFDVPYIIREGSIEDMTIDKESLALIISLDSPSDGTLSIDIPRELTDARGLRSGETGDAPLQWAREAGRRVHRLQRALYGRLPARRSDPGAYDRSAPQTQL